MEKNLISQIEHALRHIKTPLEVLDESGVLLLPSARAGERDDVVLELRFDGDIAQSQERTYIRVCACPAAYVSVRGRTQAFVDGARLAAALILALNADGDGDGRVDAERVYRRIMLEGMSDIQLKTYAVQMHLEEARPRTVLLLHCENESALIYRTLQAIFPRGGADTVVLVDQSRAALVKASGATHEEMLELAAAIQETAGNESKQPWYIGVGEPHETLAALHTSYEEARSALEVGRAFRKSERVFAYRKLLLERFLMDVDRETCAQYYKLMFNKRNMRQLSEEMLTTIDRFFSYSLNLSETSRQLFIHRNTLVYRLDKLQKLTGLDVRSFEDAVTFKMLMMMGNR